MKSVNTVFTFKLIILCFSILFINTALGKDNIDRNTETAIPRSKNIYGVGVAMLPKTSGSDEFRVLALPIINANYGDRYYINAL
ncbi:MAG: outer membrane protein, partial [Methylophilaceae bacterium]